MSGSRIVAVLGYSDGTTEALHPVCAGRLEQAARIAGPTDTVLLSGWSRKAWKTAPEADLMARSWRGPQRLLLDREARSTYGNVLGAASAARAVGAAEIVLVTSSWHARRAGALARVALRGSRVSVRVSKAPGAPSVRARLRELACWALVPAQAAVAGRRR